MDTAFAPAYAGKLPDVGTTIFTVMSALAAEAGAINLSQGFPDFPPPAGLLDRVVHHLRAGHNQYAPMAGLPALREAIARKTLDLYGHVADPDDEVTVTSGATEALYCAIESLVGPGDEALCLDPAYDSYDPAIRLAGARPVHVPLAAPGFGIDWGRLRAAITKRTRLLILNTPHNPTGAVLSADDMANLAQLVAGTGIALIGDEVYEHMVYDGRRHESLLRYPALAARSLVVSSFGKTYHATGWKIGYCVGPRELMAGFRRVHQFVQFCVATPLQWALADFLQSDPAHHRELPAFYAARRDHFCARLEGSRFRVTPSAGTYFQLADYSAITDEDDVAFARRLTTQYKVAAIPVSVFCAAGPPRHLLRFCFAKELATLDRAADILCAI
ncbi:MAG: aminotransferase class I/II-fold pyridoxal phosphate-dependent enzyme [Chromatiales bacterium]|jgi:methionine aminotransferase|nr:aminotransferase class I/II-fold pyridoxal phosphate-dependent enzyme [Chromatiales bacterium]